MKSTNILKKITAVLVVMIVCLYSVGNIPLSASADSTTKSILGDMDGDGIITNKDYGLLQRFTNAWNIEISETVADVNGDGIVNNKDLGILQRYLNGWDTVMGTPSSTAPTTTTTTTRTTATTTRPLWSPFV